MYFPTVTIDKSRKIHIVKDLNYCMCGKVYNDSTKISRKQLRKIKFKDYGEINCFKCKSVYKII